MGAGANQADSKDSDGNDDYDMTMAELAAAGGFDPPPPPPPHPPQPVVWYRNAAGQNWDGTGEMPDWLWRAVNAGQSGESYRVG